MFTHVSTRKLWQSARPASCAGTSLRELLCLAKTEETEEFPMDDMRDMELCIDFDRDDPLTVPRDGTCVARRVIPSDHW